PALLGDLLAGAFNQPGFNWMCSPAATELEVVVTNWLSDAFALPADLGWRGTGAAVLQPSATAAAIVAMLGARHRALAAPAPAATTAAALVVYVSDQAHFCIEKAARVLGVTVRKVKTARDPATGNFPMRGEPLEQLIAADAAAGLVPFFVSANFGTTGTCAV